MTLKNSDELVLIKLKQIIDFTNKIEDSKYCDVELIIAAQRTIETLVKELDYLYRKLGYKKYAS